MSEVNKTKIISFAAALFFVGAAALLIFHGAGPLKLPGIAAATTAAITAAAGYSAAAGMVGAAAASASFLAQARFGFCLDCTLAASCFAAGGLLSGAAAYNKRSAAAAIFALCLIASMSVFIYGMNKATLPAAIAVKPPTAGGMPARPSSPPTSVGPGRAADMTELYFSPWCSHCGDAVAAYVQADPEGKRWRPVVVPEAALADGEKELRNLGYRGPVTAAPSSPSGGVPCVRLPGGEIVTGSGRVTQFIPKHDRS